MSARCSTSLTVYVLSLQRGRTNLAALLLAGVALNAVLGAITSVLLLRTADLSAVRAVLSWLVGSLEGRGWDYFHVAKWPILIAAVLMLLYSRDLNLLVIGEESAQSLGVNVPRVRLILLALSSLLTASAVSIAGAIGFVGLIVPHMLRLVDRAGSPRAAARQPDGRGGVSGVGGCARPVGDRAGTASGGHRDGAGGRAVFPVFAVAQSPAIAVF